ncbi:sigma factor-like helix-turn-helix DNA-binding protein [Sorangium sp. So ce134]
MLARCGVPARDRDDVLQECLIGAVVVVREGSYRPEPGLHPRRILQRWLVGIAVHQDGRYHQKAYRRHEVAVPDPRASVTGRAPSPHGEVKARALLDLLWMVEPRERKVLILMGEGEHVSEIARSIGVPTGTAFSRLRRGRRRLAAVLKRWRRASMERPTVAADTAARAAWLYDGMAATRSSIFGSRLDFLLWNEQPLRLRREGAEHQRRLARFRDAGEHSQPPLGDLDADVVQVVLPGALDADQVVAVCGVLAPCPTPWA